MKHSAIALAVVLAPLAYAGEGDRLASVDVEGRLLEPKDKLLGFLGLQPRATYDESDQNRVTDDLRTLGYRVLETRIGPGPPGLPLKLRLEPVRVVRQITIAALRPLFDDHVLRNLRLHSCSRLRADEAPGDFTDER